MVHLAGLTMAKALERPSGRVSSVSGFFDAFGDSMERFVDNDDFGLFGSAGASGRVGTIDLDRRIRR